LAKPDVVAPGRRIVSARVPGSTIDRSMPTHIEGPLTFRLSGTSEATGVAAGAATLLLAQRPQLSPDQVKALLTRSANKLQGISASAQGSGELDAARAFRMRTPEHAAQSARPADGLLRLLFSLGPTQLARALQVNWDHINWDQVNWDQVNWDQVNWDQVNWDQVNWDQVNWDQVNWDQVNWDQVNWDQTPLD
jgi:serine protease AprX